MGGALRIDVCRHALARLRPVAHHSRLAPALAKLSILFPRGSAPPLRLVFVMALLFSLK